ncbi:MAG: aldehyde dehydrogenase family protein [Bacteroidales bacterium]|nr:aldehyde dehydrogenase family protein [Bacteroidales bacterium]
MTLENTSSIRIDAVFAAQKRYFRSEATLDVAFRKQQLKTLLQAIETHEQALADALWQDLHKSYEEAFLTEISLVKAEIRNAIRHTARWARRERKRTPVTIFGSRSYIVKEPLGTALIVSPWNYPVQLLLNPLVGAIAAGCTAVLKPSPYVPNVSLAIERMICSAFKEEYIAVIQGNREVNKQLFAQKYDLIFFTGSPALARNVAAAAAQNLTPLVLELGGKSPCIIGQDADIQRAAKRIAWGKTLNAGQTCIAPDYLLVHPAVKEAFIAAFAEAIRELHGEDIRQQKHYVRMVNDKAFARVAGYMEEGTVRYGGRTDASERFIEPTLLDGIAPEADVLTTEIFGPVFPIVTLDDPSRSFADQVVSYVTAREKPLALYYFGKEKEGWEIVRRTSSGGCCINDTIMHIVNPNVPFGGVGNSGMGHYHGRESFEAFAHRRAVIATPTCFDLPFRYMPYRLFKWVKRLV